MTKSAAIADDFDLILALNVTVRADASAWPMQSIWVDQAAVRAAPRVYK